MSVAVRPFLMFEGNAEEALNRYVSVVPGSKIIDLEKYGAGGPGKEGTVMRGTFSVGDRWCSAPTGRSSTPSPSR
jgi:predicted 3-demethylubiquinone-9 3-methyltransferase (glyoxalase superfamily)